MKKTRKLLIRPSLRGLVLALAVFALSSQVVRATPYASCITNLGSTVTFYLNESGGNVTITYDGGGPGNTNASYNGVTTGLNLPAGPQTFSLTGHTTYQISVFKAGNGVPSITTTVARGSARGITANQNGASKYFGYVYSAIGAAGVVMQHSDGSGSLGGSLKAGAGWGVTSFSPDKLTVAPDDYVIVSDFSMANGSVVRVDPTFTTSQLLLANVGQAANHGSEESQPILTGTIGVNATLYVVDGSVPSPYNVICQYNIGAGALPWANSPDVVGADVNPAGLLGYNDSGGYGFYAGLSRAANGYLYVNVQRANLSNPNLQVYAADATTLLWSSFYNGGTADYLITGVPGGLTQTGSAPSDSALSPDGKTLALVHIDNHFTVISLTNDLSGGGIPDISSEYIFPAAGTAGNGRGICWDAAGNLWMTSSGLGNVYQYSLGRTATAVTSGNATGPTGFQLLLPASTVIVTSVVNSAVGPIASQVNTYGNPTSDTFTLVRLGNVSSPLAVNFTLGGTATNGTYTVTPSTATSGITFATGQSVSNITITAVTDSKPRPTTTVTLTLGASSQYSTVGGSNSATIYIVNTGPQLLVPSAGVPSMYKALSNDYASFILTRWGDTNVASYPASSFTYPPGGTAVAGYDYTTPAAMTFAPGDITQTNRISPLVNGAVPSHALNNPYVGNKTAVIGYSGSSSTATLTIIDDANPPATVLFSDPLTSNTNGAGNDGYATWNVTWGGDNMGVNPGPDYNVDFGYDLTAANPSSGANGVIPSPPNGATTALRVTCNKTLGNASGVNVFPTNVSFSGNYAIRFNMNAIQCGNTGSATEGALFGMNHAGIYTNWWSGSGVPTRPNNDANFNWAADGIWAWMDSDPGGAGDGDYILYTGNGGKLPNTGWMYLQSGLFYTSFANNFKNPAPYTTISASAVSGIPANQSPINATPATANTWSDVELKQVGSNVTFSINKTPIFTYVNTNSFTSGTLMFGYNDPFDSLGSSDGAAYFSNLRVVRLGPLDITGFALSGPNVVINFTSTDGDDTTASFTVQSAGVVTGPYANVSPAATITQLGTGAFQAVAAQNGSARFYRIKHN